NLMIPKSLAGHNVPWAKEGKLWITRLPAPALVASACVGNLGPVPDRLTTPALRAAARPVINGFSPAGRRSIAGWVGSVVPIRPCAPDAVVLRLDAPDAPTGFP